MRVTLVAPIRTLVNVDGELAQVHAQQFGEIIQVVCAEYPKAGACTIACEKPYSGAQSFTRYRYVSEVEKTWFTSPLMRICLGEPELAAIQADIFGQPVSGAPPFSICDIDLRIFENTIALCLVEADVDVAAFSKACGELSEIESEMTRIGARIAAHVQQEFINALLLALGEVSARRHLWPFAEPLLRKPESVVVFDELASMRYPYWSREVDSLLWVHRIFDLGAASDDERAVLLGLYPKLDKRDQAYATGWGNSLYFSRSGFDAFVETCCSAQLFYCLREILSQAQKRLHRRIVTSRERLSLVAANDSFDRLEMFNMETTVELAEYRSAMSDKGRSIFEEFLETFHYEDLEVSVDSKSVMIREKIARMTLQQSASTQRISSGAVLALGAIQVIALVHNLFWFSYTVERAGSGDPFPGLTDIAQSASFDAVLTLCLLLSTMAIVVWLYLRKGRP